MTLPRRVLPTVAVLILTIGSTAVARGYAGDLSMGISAAISGPALSIGDWGYTYVSAPTFPTFSIRYWFSDVGTFEPSLGIAYLNDDGDNALRILPELWFVHHARPQEDLRPFVGFRLGVDFLTNGEAPTNIVFGPVCGAEYFVSERFSIGGEYRIVIVLPDENTPYLDDALYLTSFQLLNINFFS